MKSSLLSVLVVAATTFALAATNSSAAQSDRNAPAPSAAPAPTGMNRVAKDSVKARFTAKDLIGASVFDPAGERVGTIADVDLHEALPATLASAYNTTQQTLDRTDEPRASADSPSPAPASRPGTSSIPAVTSSRASGAIIYLSVGGLMGVGDDYVSIPASALSYNSSKERFEIASTKADVVAFAEQRADGSAMPGAAAAKHSFADEASRVQNALESDPSTSAFAYKVTVTTAGEDLELHGAVDNREQREKIVEAARRATGLKINDKLTTRN